MIFTPLDNADLVDSRRILITALARDGMKGTRYNDDGTELLEVGGTPLMLEPVQAMLRLKGPAPSRVEVLDVYGVPTGRTVPVAGDGSFRIDGTYTTYYYEVVR